MLSSNKLTILLSVFWMLDAYGSENLAPSAVGPKIVKSRCENLRWTCEIYNNNDNFITLEECKKISELEYDNFHDKQGGYKDCPQEEIEKFERANTPEELLNLYEGSPKESDIFFRKPLVFFFLLKNENNRLIAFSAWELKSDEHESKYAQIKRFHIKKEYQKGGNGRTFIEHCLKEIRLRSYLVVKTSGFSEQFFIKSLVSILDHGSLMDTNVESAILKDLNKFQYQAISNCIFSLKQKTVRLPSNLTGASRMVVVAREKVVVPCNVFSKSLCELFIVSPTVEICQNNDRKGFIERLYTTAKHFVPKVIDDSLLNGIEGPLSLAIKSSQSNISESFDSSSLQESLDLIKFRENQEFERPLCKGTVEMLKQIDKFARQVQKENSDFQEQKKILRSELIDVLSNPDTQELSFSKKVLNFLVKAFPVRADVIREQGIKYHVLLKIRDLILHGSAYLRENYANSCSETEVSCVLGKVGDTESLPFWFKNIAFLIDQEIEDSEIFEILCGWN